MKKLFDEIPYLEGERVVLRKIVEEDRETLWEMAHSSPPFHAFLSLHSLELIIPSRFQKVCILKQT